MLSLLTISSEHAATEPSVLLAVPPDSAWRRAGGILKVGNRTECALLQLVESLGVSYAQVREACAPRVTSQVPFSSDRKRMSTLVESRGGDGGAATARLHLKGAAELVLDLCTTRTLPDGSVQVRKP